jgi:hypothetical protein
MLRIRDQVFFLPLDPESGSVMERIRDPRSEANIPDHISESLVRIFGFTMRTFDPWIRAGKIRIRDGIISSRDPELTSGSATLRPSKNCGSLGLPDVQQEPLVPSQQQSCCRSQSSQTPGEQRPLQSLQYKGPSVNILPSSRFLSLGLRLSKIFTKTQNAIYRW